MGGEKKERRKKEEQTDNELPTVGVCGREKEMEEDVKQNGTHNNQEHPVVGAKTHKRGEGNGKPRRLGTPRTPIPLDLWKQMIIKL